MPTINSRSFVRGLFLLLLAALTLPITGCLAAAIVGGAAGAAAAGYAWYQADVPRDFPVNMDQAWAAAQQAVTDLGMPIVSAMRDNDGGTIESRTGDGSRVQIALEPRAARVPADGQWTHITVRVALLGDHPLSERLLNQIDTRLAPLVPHAPVVPVAAHPPAAPVVVPVVNQTPPPPLATR